MTRRLDDTMTGETVTPRGRAATEGSSIDPRLLEILVCPLTKAGLTYDRERQELVSHAARLAYPIRDGIPIMLPEEARPLEDDGLGVQRLLAP